MRRRVLAAGVGVVAIAAAVLLWRCGGSEERARPEGAPARDGIRPGVSGVFEKQRAAGRRYNDRGQPLDERGRPIGPPVGWTAENVEPVQPGELPMSPPVLRDPAEREAYRSYWVGEMKRRAGIWAAENPGSYPDDAEATRLIERLYDAAEQWPQDETAEQTMARGRELNEAMQDFLGAFGTMPHSVATFGSDPQYGAVPPSPVELPGAAPVEEAPAVDPAERTPRGRK